MACQQHRKAKVPQLLEADERELRIVGKAPCAQVIKAKAFERPGRDPDASLEHSFHRHWQVAVQAVDGADVYDALRGMSYKVRPGLKAGGRVVVPGHVGGQ